MTVEVPLSDGFVAVIDDVDALRITAFNWRLHRNSKWLYAIRCDHSGGTCTKYLMHREVLGVSPGSIVDHIDGDGLNNRRSNLREVTHSQNMQNRQTAHVNSRTGVRGVWWRASKQLFEAVVVVNKKRVFRSCFKSLDEAAAAVIAARQRFMTHSPENSKKTDR